MSKDLKQLDFYGPWKGIWQGGNAPSGSMRDMYNVMVRDGKIVTRPGMCDVGVRATLRYAFKFPNSSGYSTYTVGSTNMPGIAEHIVGLDIDNSNGGIDYACMFTGSGQSAATAITVLDEKSGPINGFPQHRIGLRESADTMGASWYTTAALIVGGSERTVAYSPMGKSGAYPTYRVFSPDGADGGDSSVTYLDKIPTGKYIAKFKGRFFIAGGGNNKNTLWFSGRNDANVFTIDVWPSNYNVDIGGKSAITGLVETPDVLYVLKEDSIYAISGDGTGGEWDISTISNSVGAVPGYTGIDVSGTIMFLAENGIYTITGGSIENISREPLADLWPKISTKGCVPYAVHDKFNSLVYFFVGSGGPSVDVIIVYDLKSGGFYRWGKSLLGWLDNSARILPSFCASIDGLFDGRVFGFIDSTSAKFCVFNERMCYDYYYAGSMDIPIPAFVETRNILDSNDEYMLLRSVFSDASNTGDWQLVIEPIVDDMSALTLCEKLGPVANIVDSTSSTDHKLDRSNPFAVGDVVDIIRRTDLYKIGDSITVANPGALGADYIKLGTSFDSSADPRDYLIVKENTFPVFLRTMYENSHEVLGNAAAKWAYESGATVNTTCFSFSDENNKRAYHSKSGILGKRFAIRIGNVGSWTGTVSGVTRFCKTCSKLDLRGFGIHVRGTGVSR